MDIDSRKTTVESSEDRLSTAVRNLEAAAENSLALEVKRELLTAACHLLEKEIFQEAENRLTVMSP